jgi:hypothetical protein
MKRYTLKTGLIALMLFFFANSLSAQTLTTDQEDYPPGATAIISGTGFLPGETLTLQVTHAVEDSVPNTGEDHFEWEVIADSLGNFVTSWHVCEDDCLGAHLLAIADGNTSGLHAEVEFTDAARCLQSVNASGTQTVCQNEGSTPLTLSTTSGGTGSPVSLTYQWYSNSVNNNTSGTSIAGATSSSYSPPTNIVGVTYYYCVVTNTNGAGICTGGSNRSNTIAVTINSAPTTADAGPDQTICGSSATLAGNIPSVGTGAWSLISGSGTVSTINSAFSTVTGLGTGLNTFRWTISNGTCTSSDNVNITVNTPPVISLSSTAINKTASHGTCSATATYNIATATGTPTPAISYSPISGSSFSVGTTTVTATATNSCGSSNETFTITVVDEEKPTANPPADIIQNTDAGQCYATVNLGTPTANDNCGIQSITNNAPSNFPVGVTVVTWNVTDVNGNQKIPLQLVTISDNENPNAIAKNITVNLDSAGTANIVASDIDNGSNDACGIKTISVSKTSFNCSNLGANTVVLTVTDNHDNVSTANAVVTIEDHIAPVVSCPVADSVYRHLDPYSTTYSIQGNEFNATATDNCALASLTYNLYGATTGSGTSLSGVALNNGRTSVRWTAIDSSGNISRCWFYIGVGVRPTTITINQPTPSITSAQYSDSISLRAELVDYQNLKVNNKPVVFQVGSQVFPAVYTDINGIATTRVRLNQNPNTTTNDNVTATFTADATYGGSTDTDAFNVIREDACGVYNGILFANTNSETGGSATVRLKVVVKEPNDGSLGDVRLANVAFTVMDGGTTILNSGAATLEGGSTSTLATFYKDVTISLSSTVLSKTLDVNWVIAGYYTDASCSEKSTQVTVSAPASDFITGGGYEILQNSAGLFPGDVNSKNNFGFSVKWNKNLSNIQAGGINTIIRKNGHIYQVKGNRATYLNVVPKTSTAPATAIFYGNAVIKDITDPSNIISMEGNASVIIAVTDVSEPGSSGINGTPDSIAITVKDKNGMLWFSNNWNGTKTLKQALDGGNIQIRTAGPGRSMEMSEESGESEDSTSAISAVNIKNDPRKIKIFPNPTNKNQITISISGYEKGNQAVKLYVFDVTGKMIHSNENFCLQNCNENILEIDQKYSSGTYLIDLVIEDKVYHQKLIIQ